MLETLISCLAREALSSMSLFFVESSSTTLLWLGVIVWIISLSTAICLFTISFLGTFSQQCWHIARQEWTKLSSGIMAGTMQASRNVPLDKTSAKKSNPSTKSKPNTNTKKKIVKKKRKAKATGWDKPRKKPRIAPFDEFRVSSWSLFNTLSETDSCLENWDNPTS